MNNVLQLVWLIPLLPLIGFLINGLLRKQLSKSLTSILGSGVILGSFVVSLLIFFQVKQGHTAVVNLFDFISVGKLSIPFSFQVDQLSSIFLLIITGVGFLIHVYSAAYMHEEEGQHYARYFAYLNLFVFSMLLLVLGSNYVIMFIGWEGVGLCSYLLIGYWFKNIDYTNAAKKAFVMNRIGDLGFLLAIFWIIGKFGTVSYGNLFEQVAANAKTLEGSAAIVGITLLLFIGATGKSAQIPLYTWLPDAMAGPTPVSALIHAATMVTAGIYMIARSNILYTLAPFTNTIVAIIGLATALFAATIAIKQNDIKKVLAYSTVSQLGYMFLGLGVGAYTGAVFHVMTHAFFKALLFLGAGSVIHAMHHEQDIRRMGGLKKYLPITHLTFLLGCIAIAGIPPFSGFFSKDEILAAAYAANPVYWVIGVITAGMTAFYMFRLYATTFLGQFRGAEHLHGHHPHESPAAMTIPLIVLAILSVIGGWVGIPEVLMKDAHSLEHFLDPIFAASSKFAHPHHLSHSTEYGLMGASVLLAVILIFFAIGRYSKRPELGEPTGFGKVLANKWYVDELYNAIIVKPLNWIGKFLNNFVERDVIDWTVNGVGKVISYSSRQVRLLQSGQVGSYVLLMVLGILAFFVIQFFVKK
ncbi:NADH-quinone oxidoreductase subunit L [Paraflavitalea sp. CAU 1676]|uniref:NADH-quinone oxidoreductase subunit L n=1 Tax=Paraflavitalea sp. CAU 1676 TaxID=3032598 RepID=UPI0023DB5B61|nr:NADH-quinone oxidoreductase subunit L [Paraflavitalea sp. CAU 1676]MDF2192977.1 NADH-quinone oxidoreductase subunit L [Paraflavitalea sp. CAU 1676]